MVAMGTSIDMIEHAPPGTQPPRYLNRARRSLGRMNRLVQSATEATSLEAALSVERSEPLDLSVVVGERVLVFRQAHPRRTFLAHIEPGLEIHGQEDRVAQLLDKPSIFEAFVTNEKRDRTGQNLGLGLFVANAIAQAHASQLIASDLDDVAGARFEVRIPIEVI